MSADVGMSASLQSTKMVGSSPGTQMKQSVLSVWSQELNVPNSDDPHSHENRMVESAQFIHSRMLFEASCWPGNDSRHAGRNESISQLGCRYDRTLNSTVSFASLTKHGPTRTATVGEGWRYNVDPGICVPGARNRDVSTCTSICSGSSHFASLLMTPFE